MKLAIAFFLDHFFGVVRISPALVWVNRFILARHALAWNRIFPLYRLGLLALRLR
jgi:hypothetical protein